MWYQKENKLTREFAFNNFVEALEFVNKVSEIAERVGHHPEIWFTWGRVIITTTTHDEGNIITEKDWNLTRLIDELV